MTQLIVGAGATGLVAALELARRGLSFRIIEKRDAPSSLSRAVGILPMSIPILERLGVADRIRDEAISISHGVVHDGATPVLRLPMNVLQGRDLRLFCLPQDRTEAILAERLIELGVRVEYARSFRALEQQDDRVRVQIDDEKAEFEHVLGADGAHSPVRTAVGLTAEGHDLPTPWSIADIDLTDPWDAAFSVCLLPDGNAIFIVPIGTSRLRVVASVPDALKAVPITLPIAKVRREGEFTIGIRQVPTYRAGRVWLAGDAAHTHSPVGGRGMNLGMADGAEWAVRLAEGTLDGYDASRHAAGARIITFTESVRKRVMTPDGWRRRLALRVVAAALSLSPVVKRINRAILLPGYEAPST